jgi:hypothetical protein
LHNHQLVSGLIHCALSLSNFSSLPSSYLCNWLLHRFPAIYRVADAPKGFRTKVHLAAMQTKRGVNALEEPLPLKILRTPFSPFDLPSICNWRSLLIRPTSWIDSFSHANEAAL